MGNNNEQLLGLEVWKQALTDARKVLTEFAADPKNMEQCAAFADSLVKVFKDSKKVLICGNGGSHCDALHFAEEFTGRYRSDRPALPVIALGEAAHATCVGNDYGFEKIFARHVEALGAEGDLLVVLSTSGNSPNILAALKAAEAKKMTTVALLGKGGGQALKLAQNPLVVPGKTADRIQELHMIILHTAIEQVERELFPGNYGRG